jgi:hypothetical protein
MKNIIRIAIWAVLVFAAWPLVAQPPRPLLRINTRVETRAHALLLSHEHFFVAKSGFVVGEITESRLLSVGWEYSPFAGDAPRPALRELADALGENQVGFMPNSCTADSGFRSTGTYELTWYGAGMRTQTVLITLVSGTEPTTCPPEVLDVTRAVRQFLFDSVGAATTVVGH